MGTKLEERMKEAKAQAEGTQTNEQPEGDLNETGNAPETGLPQDELGATAESATESVLTEKVLPSGDSAAVAQGVAKAVAESKTADKEAAKAEQKSVFSEKALGDAAARASETGLASSVEGLAAFVPTPGSFKHIKLPVFVTAKGERVLANAYGYYVKEEMNTEKLELLEYYFSKGLVEKVIGA